jgi:hypothetical protein
MDFLDHFNSLPRIHGLRPVKELDDKTLQCTRSGQVMLDFPQARSLMDVIRDYYVGHKGQPVKTLQEQYYSESRPHIDSWTIAEFQGQTPVNGEILWEPRGSSQFEGVTIDKYLLHHSRYLKMPLLYMHREGSRARPVLFLLGESGKATSQDWPAVTKYLDAGYNIVSFDPRGMGETRMAYKAVSPDDPALAKFDFDQAYNNPLSGVLADYVYNSILTGRPYLFQMIEDVEIASRFVKSQLNPRAELAITGTNGASTLAGIVSQTLPNIKLLPPTDGQALRWSELVDHKSELWPIQYLLPGGAYVP